MTRRLPVVAVGLALAASQALAVYPRGESGAAGFSLAVDMVLLLLAARGRKWALNLLTAFTVLGAFLFVTAGAFQVGTEPRYLIRGIAEAVAAVLLLRAWRGVRSAQ